MNGKLAIALLALAAAACEQDGPAESIGERVDEAAESVGEAARDVRDETEEYAENVIDNVENSER